MRPAAAEDGDTDGEEGHGDDDAGPGGVQGQPRTHAVAVIALVVTVLLYGNQFRYYRAGIGCRIENVEKCRLVHNHPYPDRKGNDPQYLHKGLILLSLNLVH